MTSSISRLGMGTVLYRLVREHLETFLDLARRMDREVDSVLCFVETI